MLNRTTLFGCFGLLLGTALLPTGCDPDYQGGPATAEVVGTVLLDGHPVPNARVVFIPFRTVGVSGGREVLSYGLTDTTGNFKLRKANGEFGAAKGFHRVVISKKNAHAEDVVDLANGPLSREELAQPADEEIPAIYNQQSKLTFNVDTSIEIVRATFELNSVDPMLDDRLNGSH